MAINFACIRLRPLQGGHDLFLPREDARQHSEAVVVDRLAEGLGNYGTGTLRGAYEGSLLLQDVDHEEEHFIQPLLSFDLRHRALEILRAQQRLGRARRLVDTHTELLPLKNV